MTTGLQSIGILSIASICILLIVAFGYRVEPFLGNREGGYAPGRKLAAIICLLLLPAAVLAARAAMTPDSSSARTVAMTGLLRLNEELRRQTQPFSLILGDSHAVSLAVHVGCPAVVAAANGLKAADVADQIARMNFPQPPSHALLVVGTNDLLKRRRPHGRGEAWAASVRRTVLTLKGMGTQVTVAAVPPFGATMASTFEASAVQSYSSIAERLCTAEGCTYLDPWRDSRLGETGIGKEEALPDGVHLQDYAKPMAALRSFICPPPAGDDAINPEAEAPAGPSALSGPPESDSRTWREPS